MLIKVINEMQHQVSGYIGNVLTNEPGYSEAILCSVLLDIAKDYDKQLFVAPFTYALKRRKLLE